MLQRLHRWQVPKPIVELINRWLHARVWNAWMGSRHAGTSQGGALSPLLCNLYLHPFDQTMQKPDLWLVRYADDLVVLSRGKAGIQYARQRAVFTLHRMGLSFHPQKTRLTTFSEGFQFVGWFFVRDECYQLK